MNDRPTPADMPLKALTRDLIEAAGGLDAAAACLRGRVGRSQLANYQSPHHEQFMPIDVLCRLAQVTGRVELISEMAARVSHRLVPEDAAAAGCAVEAVAAVMKEVSEAGGALARGMADGSLSVDDEEAVRSELLDVSRVAAARAASLGKGRLRAIGGTGGAA
ncbi:phage regulatory CII family protein [Muricoccus aerilatus]|uniref:phage regulatory CII family protein n=1 Tax=Muricoccus aerilatus TaxID=452982 RepID=UPI0005C16C0D|nr:phage regulatory CII family protein [Roseomonas aerilata]